MNSSVVIVGADKKSAQSLADRVGAAILAQWPTETSGIDVVVLELGQLDATDPMVDLKRLVSTSPTAQAVLVGSARTPILPMVTALSKWIPIFGWSPDFQSSDLEEKILSALSASRERRQSAESLTLYHQHNESLQRLSTELEARIEARRLELSESSMRLQQSQRRGDTLHRALNAVHLSQSIAEIESRLAKVLHAPSDAPHVDWIKIAITSLSQLGQSPLQRPHDPQHRHGPQERQNPGHHSEIAVPIGTIGHVYFGRSVEKPFRSDDRTFLTPIAEAVSLAVTRLQTIERMDLVRREWEETFNSISDPVAVIDEQLNVVRGNRALIRDRRPESIIGKPCYSVVFSRESPCPNCPVIRAREANRGRIPDSLQPQVFRIEPRQESDSFETYEVSSRPIQSNDPLDPQFLVHLYRDDTTAARFERRITESAKMAELGTIGSSIAHQLNNPIGGMLSLIQLLLMDLDGKPEAFPGARDLQTELREMEAGTRRCAQIVRDLLGFSRRGAEDAPGEHDLEDLIQQAIKITELQTRSRGLRFQLKTRGIDFAQSDSLIVVGRFNLLAQAIRAVLLATISDDLRDQIHPIILEPSERRDRATITVPCATGVRNPDLTIAREIIAEHGGTLELLDRVTVQEARFELPIKSLTAKI